MANNTVCRGPMLTVRYNAIKATMPSEASSGPGATDRRSRRATGVANVSATELIIHLPIIQYGIGSIIKPVADSTTRRMKVAFTIAVSLA